MFKNINWKSIFKSFAWIICLAGLVVLMSFVGEKKRTVKIVNVKIMIPGADNFIEREEIDAVLKQSQGALIGRSLEEINLHAIEKKIQSNPYIAMATVYADMDGVIHIEIKQRQPILRVINAGGQDYYIDRNGLKMPVSPNFTANVLVANGNILEHFSGRVDTLLTKLAADLYSTALFIKRDTLWDAQIEQLYVNDKADIELIPRVGNQRIILGSADSLDVKMRNLMAFYKQAMPKVGWDTYKTINIKYTNQVVCEKNKPDSLPGKAPYRAKITDTVKANKGVIDALVLKQIALEMKNDGDDPYESDEAAAARIAAAKSAKTEVKPATVKPAAVVKPPAVTKPASAIRPAVVKPKAPVVKPVSKPVAKPVHTASTNPAVKKPADHSEKKIVKAAVKKPAAANEKVKTDTKKNK